MQFQPITPLSPAAQALVAAMLGIYSGPKRWTQGCFARTVDGKPTTLFSEGISFCFQGCLAVANQPRDRAAKLEIESAGVQAIAKDETVLCWQDQPERTFADVLALLHHLLDQSLPPETTHAS